ELVELSLAFLARALLLDLRSRAAGAGIVARHVEPGVQRTLLLHVQLLLPQGLVELQLIERLPLPRVARWTLGIALLLLHAQLQLVLLLLAQELVLLQRAHARRISRKRRARE